MITETKLMKKYEEIHVLVLLEFENTTSVREIALQREISDSGSG